MIPESKRRVDVHVLTVQEHARYQRACFDSLSRERINLHVLKGHDKDIGKGRYEGFRQGEAEFVAYVDDDCTVKPDAFENCVALLDNHPGVIGVVTNEERISMEGKISVHKPFARLGYAIANMNQLIVWRRELILPYTDYLLECPYRSEHVMVLRTLADGHKYAHFDGAGYVHRNHLIQPYRGNPPCEKYKGEMADLQTRARANR